MNLILSLWVGLFRTSCV